MDTEQPSSVEGVRDQLAFEEAASKQTHVGRETSTSQLQPIRRRKGMHTHRSLLLNLTVYHVRPYVSPLRAR